MDSGDHGVTLREAAVPTGATPEQFGMMSAPDAFQVQSEHARWVKHSLWPWGCVILARVSVHTELCQRTETACVNSLVRGTG